jgi:P27 family predicted phage terminase small subunit
VPANRSRAGRPGKSEELKVLRGKFPGSKKRPPGPPKDSNQPLSKAPKPPEWLTAIAAEEWKRVTPDLVRRELLRKSDLMPLAVYCDAVSTWRTAMAVLAKQGQSMEVETKAGGFYYQQRPEVSIAHQARKQVIDFSREFFLTPSSAKLVGAGNEKPTGDEWDSF